MTAITPQLAEIMRRSDPLEALDGVFAHPARVQGRATNAELLQLASSRGALDDVIFTERPPYFWTAEISSNRLDAYYTRMSPATTLRNFASDATEGVSFQNSHGTQALGFGRSLRGQYLAAGADGVARVEADFYTVPGLRLNTVSTDDLINGIRSGLIKDVSVGFFGGRFVCTICGRDVMRDWDCPHIPGLTYDAESAASSTGTLATATVEDAHLAEVSAVYDGATPGAAILKAVREADAGRIRPQAVRLLEQRYRMRLPTARVQQPGWTPAPRPWPPDEVYCG